MKAQLYGKDTLVRKPKRPVGWQSMATLTLGDGGSCVSPLHLHQGGIERSTTTQIGEPIGGEQIDVETAFRQLGPA